MKVLRLITSFLILVPYYSYAEPEVIRVEGTASEFSGSILSFYLCPLRHFDICQEVASAPVDSSGHFEFTFTSLITTALYFETPLYTGYLFAEKGRKYSLVLPPADPEESASLKDPFYNPPSVHILPGDSVIAGLRDLNYAIHDFEKEFEPFSRQNLFRFSNTRLSRMQLDSFLQVHRPSLSVTDSSFLKEYILYKAALSEFLVSEYNRSELYKKYFEKRHLPVNNPAFWDFYRLYFDNYLGSLTVREEFEDLYEYMGTGQYNRLRDLLKRDPVLQNDTILEMVLLEELFNGFFENKFPLQMALDLFDTVSSETHSGMIKNIASDLRKKITFLQPGYPSPDFRLRNNEGEEYTSESFKGKYCYFGFCSLNNRDCQKEFEYLKLQNSRHGKYLQIVTIVPEKEKDLIDAFKDFHSINWPVLYSTNEGRMFRDFKVKTYPVFYLFDKTGKFLLSPSPLPSENFEQALFRIMRSKGEL